MSSEWKTLRELIETRGINGEVIVSCELGLNHNGDMALAMKMIEAAAEAGCHAVKVQNYRTGDVVKSRSEEISVDVWKLNAWELFSSCELALDELKAIKDHAESCGLIFHSTPTNEQGIRDLKSLGVRIVKIASDVALTPDIIRYAHQQQMETIISMGCLGFGDIEHLPYGSLLLHCVREYPTSLAHAALSRIGELRIVRSKYAAPLIGYSDHCEGIDCAVSAVRDYKACWVEVHTTLDHSLPGPDHRWSKTFSEVAELVRKLKNA